MMRAAILIVVASGCGRKPADREDRGSARPAPTATADAGATAAVEVHAAKPPTVTLVKPGSEPRRTVRYAPASGERTAKLTFDIGAADAPEGIGMGFAVTLAWKTPASATAPYEFHVADSQAILPKDLQAKGGKGGEAATIGALGGMFAAIAGRVEADPQGRATLVRTSSTIPT